MPHLLPTLLTVSILMCLVAIGWAVALLVKFRDWRVGFLAAMLVMLTVPQVLRLARDFGLLSFSLPEVVAFQVPLSVVSLLAVLFLGWFLADQRRVEQELERKRSELQLVFDSVPALIFHIDRQHRIILANHELARLVGVPREALEGRTAAEYGSPFAEQYHRDNEEIYATGQPKRGLIEPLDTVSGTRWLQTDKMPYRDVTGQIVGIVGFAVDITERKRVEEALRVSEKRHRIFADLTSDYVYVFRVEPDGRLVIEWMSESVTRIMGYSVEEFRALPSPFDVIYPDDRPAALENQRRIMAGETTALETRFITKHGELRWLRHYARPIWDAGHRRVVAIYGASQDITERKRAEAALRESELRFRSLVEQAADGIVLANEEGWYQDVNSSFCAMVGYTRDELLRMHARDVVVPEAQARVTPALAEFAIDRPYLRDWLLRRKDGTVFPVEVNGRRLPDGRLLGIVRDITERKRAEQQIRQYSEEMQHLSRRLLQVQEAERRHLARELHDEIGQVLSAISVNLKIVRTKVDSAAVLRMDESIGMVDRAVNQVRNLSLDLRPAVLDDFGLEPALRWYANGQAERAGFTVHLTAEVPVVELPTDLRNACFRIAQEALTNVVRHARASEVWIELQQDEQEMSLTIHDNGQGFDAAAAQQRVSRGGSLGLLSMRERAELLGGEAQIHSEPSGSTTVSVRFPLQSWEEAVVGRVRQEEQP